MGGLVRNAVERFPPQLFLRETPLTQPDTAIIEFAQSFRAEAGDDALALLHAMMTALNREIAFDTDPTHAATTAAEAFALRRGVCQDLTHIFVAATRALGIPARYIGGHFHRADGVTSQEAGHAWAEAHVEALGGSALTRPTGSARPMPMCVLRRGSTIWAPHRSAAPVMAAVAKL